MNQITFPLKLQIERPVVADLHRALAHFGAGIAGVEKANQHFGQFSREAQQTLLSPRVGVWR
jgi:hypothetical protein